MAVVRVAGVIALLAGLVVPGDARAARVVDPKGGSVVALRGTLVSMRASNKTGRTSLFRRVRGRFQRVPGIRPLIGLDLDLGIDRRGRPVGVYHRCDYGGACSGPYIFDVRAGGERPLRIPQRRGCRTSKGEASVWRDQIAYTRSCPGGGSGVFVVSGDGRPRRLFRSSARDAMSINVDLIRGFARVGTRVVSTGARRCEVSPPPPPPDFEVGPSYLTPAGVLWWVEEDVGEYGGAVTTLRSAKVGRGCSMTPPTPPVSLDAYNDDTFFESISVDAGRLYFANLAVPLAALR
jgi:hypothetical protein